MVHITLLVSTLLSFIRHHKRSLITVSFVLLFVFSALRYGFGNDYFSYLNIFNTIKITGWHSYLSSNPLFILLNKYSPNFQVFIAITSFIFLFAVYMLIIRNVDAKYHIFAVGLFLLNPYLFLMQLSSIRQSLAVAMFILAVFFAIKRKPVYYVAVIILASLFHTSAILLLPFYFLINDKKPTRVFLIVFVVIVALLTLSPVSYDWFIGLFEEFLMKNRYDRYLTGSGNSLNATLVALMYFLYGLININKLEGKSVAFGKLYLLSSAVSVLAYRISLFVRIGIYFDIFSIVAVPLIIAANVKKEKDGLLRAFNIYIIPALIFGTLLIKYYNFFFVDTTWIGFQTYKMNFTGLFT